MDPVTALAMLGGAARWPALQRAGVSRGRLVEACRRGDVVRPARGAFALRGVLDEPWVRALTARGQLSCAHAAVAHGLDVFALPDRVHVRIPPGSARRHPVAGVDLHPWGSAGDGPTAPLVETLRDCVRCLEPAAAVGVLDSAVRRGRITLAELASASSTWRAAEAAAVRLVDPQSQSVLESVGRVLLVTAGMGPVVSQVHVSRVGWVDLVIAGWLVVELDGFATHRESFQEDRRRDAELVRLGFVVLRFTYADLVHRRSWFLEVVQETLDRGRPPFAWRGP